MENWYDDDLKNDTILRDFWKDEYFAKQNNTWSAQMSFNKVHDGHTAHFAWMEVERKETQKFVYKLCKKWCQELKLFKMKNRFDLEYCKTQCKDNMIWMETDMARFGKISTASQPSETLTIICTLHIRKVEEQDKLHVRNRGICNHHVGDACSCNFYSTLGMRRDNN